MDEDVSFLNFKLQKGTDLRNITLNRRELVIPKSWRVVKLGELARVGLGKKPPSGGKGKNVPVYGINGVEDYTDRPMITESKVVAISRVISQCPPRVIESPAWISEKLVYILPDASLVLPEYLAKFIEFIGVETVASGSVIPRISLSDLKKLEIILPPLCEQRRIVSVLEVFDNLLNILGRVAEKFNGMKRTVIDTYTFSNNQQWDIVSLREVVKPHGRSVKSSEDFHGIPVLGPTDFQSGTIYLKSSGTIEETKKLKPKYLFHKGEVLYVRLMPHLDRVAVATFDGACTQDILVLSPNTSMILPEYLVLVFHSSKFLNYVSRVAMGTGFSRISWRDISGFKFPLPPIEEQKRVVEQVLALEEAVHLKQEKISKFRAIRKFIMGVLFTGQVRIQPTMT